MLNTPANKLMLALTAAVCLSACQPQGDLVAANSPRGGGIEGTGIICQGLMGAEFTAVDQCLLGSEEYGGGDIVGTGIIGTITGFGSIIVNGIHIEYEQEQNVESILGQRSGKDLQIGQVVAVATNIIDGEVIAQRIVQQTALTGIVESINKDSGNMVVSGVQVSLLDMQSSALDSLTIGENIALSGMPVNGEFQISHVEKNVDVAPSVSGYVMDESESAVVLDSGLVIAKDSASSDLVKGDFVNVGLASKDQLKVLYKANLDGVANRVLRESWSRDAKRNVEDSKVLHAEPRQPMRKSVVATEKVNNNAANENSGSTVASSAKSNNGNANSVKAASANASNGNANSGSASNGNANSGSASNGNASNGNASNGNASSGNASSGNASSGNAKSSANKGRNK